jgi:hypothetical protein
MVRIHPGDTHVCVQPWGRSYHVLIPQCLTAPHHFDASLTHLLAIVWCLLGVFIEMNCILSGPGRNCCESVALVVRTCVLSGAAGTQGFLGAGIWHGGGAC